MKMKKTKDKRNSIERTKARSIEYKDRRKKIISREGRGMGYMFGYMGYIFLQSTPSF